MADTTAKLILYRLNETLTNMADTILSFFYIDESKETLDVVNMLFVGWILLGILVYFLGTFIASQLESVRENAQVEPSKTPTEESNEELSKSDEKNGGKAKPSKRISTGAADVVVGPVEEAIVASSVSNVLGAPRVGPLAHVPIATGNDAGSVRWINNILIWFNSTAKIPILNDCWVHSLNEQAAKLTTENGIQVEFDKVGEGCPKPELRDVQVSAESNNNVTVNCKVLAKQLLLHLLATRTMGKSKTSTDYQLLLERLDGKLKVTCNTEDKLLVVKFVEKPDVQLNLKLSKSGALKESALDQRALEDAIVDVAIEALTNAIVDFHLSQDPDFPNYVKDKASISPSSFSSAADLEQAVARHEQRLFVKVIKASHLGGEKGCQEAYCIVEMDDPAQKFQTASIKATNSPFWDEHFLFNLKSTSAEVLFEIYDKGKKVGENFMGLGIVSVEELLKNPSQRQIISLQSRPLENDKVTGSLTAEFLFMEGSEVPIRQQPGRTVETNSRVTSGGKIITTTTIKKSAEEVPNGLPSSDLACMDTLIESSAEKSPSFSSGSRSPSPPSPYIVHSSKSSTLPRSTIVTRGDSTDSISEPLSSRSKSLRSSDPMLAPYQKPSLEIPVIRPKFENITLLKKSPPVVVGSLKKSTSQDITFVKESNIFDKYKSWDHFVSIPSIGENNNMVSEKNRFNEITNDKLNFDQSSSETLKLTGLKQSVNNNDSTEGINNFLVNFEKVALPNTDWRNNNSSKMVVDISPVATHYDELDLPPLELPNSPPPIPEPATTKSPFSLAIISKGPLLRVIPPSPNETFDSVNDTSNPSESVQSDTDTHETKIIHKKLKGRKWLMSKFKSKKKDDAKDTGTVDDSVPLTDTALKEIEQMGKTGMSTNKSTLIIHSVQRELVRPTVKVKLDKDGRWHEVPATQTNGGDESGSISPSSPTSKKPPSVAESASSTSDKDDRSARTKERKSFMGTLRKRLSFKKNRSKSVDPNGVDGQESSSGRSASGDRSKSVPGSREQSQGRQPSHLGVPGGGSTRSSISEGSGFSGASSRTYINENSTLVIEINENGITKHYLIPFSLASRSKWRKRGLKLHIYNDHTFVAKHISGSVICQVCTRHFPRRPGKQAYSCRDCDLQCHKTCHVKVDSRCPNSTIHSLEMEYVQDPRIKSTSS